MSGLTIALFGAALATFLCGIGSVLGIQQCGCAAAGVTAEKPDLFGKLLVLQILPGTQGLYGFLATIILLVKIGVLGGNPVDLTVAQGWNVFMACLPIAISGLVSAIYQGKVAAAGILMTAKRPEASGKGITMAVLIETYAILALIISILMILGLHF